MKITCGLKTRNKSKIRDYKLKLIGIQVKKLGINK